MYLKKLKIERQSLLVQHLNYIQDYICLICLDLVIDPVSCSVCNTKFCISCACNWKYQHNQCPKKCHSPWSFKKMDTLNVKLYCPFDKQCGLMIPQQIQNHIAQCNKAPEQIVSLRNKRSDYKCRNNHPLEFWQATFIEMTNAICAQCKQKIVSRSICRKCNQKYCVQCRPPPCTNQHCPYKHKFIFNKNISKQYICDLCGLRPYYFEQGAYTDQKCNFGICQSCHSKASKKKNIKINTNKHDFCLNNHYLEYLKEKKYYSKCSDCQNEIPITRICKKCQLQYCIKCKPPYINCYNLCIKQHEITKVINKSCLLCENQFQSGLADQLCGFQLCQECHSKLLTQSKFKQRISQIDCSFCSTVLKLNQSVMIINQQCQDCNEKVKCPLECQVCQLYFCYDCKPPLMDCQDYYGHQIKELKKFSNDWLCLKCDKQIKKGYGCNPCNFVLCQKCFKKQI